MREKSNIKQKKCLVTGAAGFIGSHLCEELVNLGYKVTAFIHYNSRDEIGNLKFLSQKILKKIKIIKGDIQDPFIVDTAVKGQDYVFHLAALIGIPYSYLAPANYVSVNIGGTLNVLEAVKRHKVNKMIHTSTSEAYGSAVYTPIDERHPLQGQSPYSASKIGADKLVESYSMSFDLPVATIRPFNAFGPRQSSRAVIPVIISQLLSGTKDVELGSVSPIRDFNYVKDAVDGFVKIAFSKTTIGGVFNIGSGKGYSIKEVFCIIKKIMGSSAKIKTKKTRIRPEKSEVKELLCNYELAKKTFGYQPEWSIDDGLKKTVEFMEENIHLYNSKQYTI
ncbi:MAG: SDR family NAD(P)-dependent oxidoreductase [Parcubacteria group bacterium]|nr:SDR family NAD(P)-dependent oxidoreductase [Parcubacteria group bacterium]